MGPAPLAAQQAEHEEQTPSGTGRSHSHQLAGESACCTFTAGADDSPFPTSVAVHDWDYEGRRGDVPGPVAGGETSSFLSAGNCRSAFSPGANPPLP